MRLLRLLCVAFFFAFSTPVFATDFAVPTQKIVGVEEVVPLGEIVDVSVSKLEDKPEYYISSSYTWKVIDLADGKEKKVRAHQNGIFFGSGIVPKKYRIYCAATYLYVVKDGTDVKEIGTRTVILSADLVIGGNVPVPPNPNPTPPVFPDGQFKLAAFGYNSAVSAVKPGAGRGESARALANSFRSVAAAIRAGTIKTDKEVLEKTHQMNNEALGKAVADWEEFSELLQEKLFELYKSGKLKTLTEYADAWTELASGLDKVDAITVKK